MRRLDGESRAYSIAEGKRVVTRNMWHRGDMFSHRCRAAYAAPLPGGLRRSAKTFTAKLVYRQAVGDGWAAKRDGTRSGIHGAAPFVGRSRKLGEECVAVPEASTIFVFFSETGKNWP